VTYRISKNIPIPERRGPGERTHSKRLKYPFDRLDIGESFMVPASDPAEKNRVRGRLTGTSIRFKDREFAIRNVNKGVRVWRIG
jgi:hypothetical protein